MSDHISKQEYHSLWKVIMELQKEISELRMQIDSLIATRRRVGSGMMLLEEHKVVVQKTEE